MVTRLIHVFKSHSELGAITHTEWDEYNLSIYSENWSLNSTSAWRVISNSGFFGLNNSESKTELGLLRGARIIAIDPLGELDIDFSLSLDNNTKVQIFCTTYFEPWIFRFKNDITLVACV